MSRGRLFWLVTLPKFGVGRIGVRVVVEDHHVERVEELDVELAADASADRHLLDDRDVHSFRNGLRIPSMRDGK